MVVARASHGGGEGVPASACVLALHVCVRPFLRVCACACTCTCVRPFLRVCACACTCVRPCLRVHACAKCACVRARVRASVRAHACVCVRACVRARARVCACTCVRARTRAPVHDRAESGRSRPARACRHARRSARVTQACGCIKGRCKRLGGGGQGRRSHALWIVAAPLGWLSDHWMTTRPLVSGPRTPGVVSGHRSDAYSAIQLPVP
jgi:hypothetical protein